MDAQQTKSPSLVTDLQINPRICQHTFKFLPDTVSDKNRWDTLAKPCLFPSRAHLFGNLLKILTSLNITFQIITVVWMIHKYICPASPMTCPVYKNAITAMQICIDDIRSWMEHDKLTSREIGTQRDQFSNQQLPLGDDHLIALQHEQHLSNYPDSECSKGPLRHKHPTPLIDVGDLVYLYSDRNKFRARDRYLVLAIDPPFCDIKKFIGF